MIQIRLKEKIYVLEWELNKEELDALWAEIKPICNSKGAEKKYRYLCRLFSEMTSIDSNYELEKEIEAERAKEREARKP